MSEAIVTVPFRLAFPEVFQPKAALEGGKAKYSITMLFPADGSALIPSMPGNGILELRKLCVLAVKEKWGDDKAKWPANMKSLDFKEYLSPNGKDGWPIRNGDDVEWDGFAGCIFARASSTYAPGVVDAKTGPVIDPAMIHGGLICRASINAFAYHDQKTGSKGVSFGLNHIQVLKDDGTSFGGRANVKDVFKPFGEEGAVTNAPDDFFD